MLVSCSLLLYFAVIFAHSSRKAREKKTPCTNIYLIDVMVSDLHCLNFLFALEKKNFEKKLFWQSLLQTKGWKSLKRVSNRSTTGVIIVKIANATQTHRLKNFL